MRSPDKKAPDIKAFRTIRPLLWKYNEADKYQGNISDANTKPRSALLDNARLVAASLILVMHFLEISRASSVLIDYSWYATWGFRLPVYILIAGYFSQDSALSIKQQITLLRNVLFVYISFEVVAWLQTGILKGAWKFDPLNPSFAMWFLLTLFTWRVTLPYASQIKHILPISFIISFGIGFIASAGHTLSISRTLAFWPLFLLGWKLRTVDIRRTLQKPWIKYGATTLTLIAIGTLWVYYEAGKLTTRHFHMRSPYKGEIVQKMTEGSIRIAILLFGTCAAVALLSWLTPRFIPIITYLGSGSFYIYVLHPIIHRQVTALDIFPDTSSKFEIGLLTLGLIALSFILGSRPVRAATRWLVQPQYQWLFVSGNKARPNHG